MSQNSFWLRILKKQSRRQPISWGFPILSTSPGHSENISAAHQQHTGKFAKLLPYDKTLSHVKYLTLDFASSILQHT